MDGWSLIGTTALLRMGLFHAKQTPGGWGAGGEGRVALTSYTNEVMSLDCLEVRTSKTGVQTGREGSGSFIVAYS